MVAVVAMTPRRRVRVRCARGSLFIAALAFPDTALTNTEARLGVIVGSLLSAVLGASLLTLADRRRAGSSPLDA